MSAYAKATGSHAEGINTVASGSYSHAEGNGSAEGNYSHAEGYKSIAKGNYSHAEGLSAYAKADGSHAEGNNSRADGNYAHAEGYKSIAEGTCSHAEGLSTYAKASGSHAEGYFCKAEGTYSHAAGAKAEVHSNDTWAWSYNESTVYSVDRRGTFNINPLDGVKGFYIGNDNFVKCVLEAMKMVNTDSSLSSLKSELKTALQGILA